MKRGRQKAAAVLLALSLAYPAARSDTVSEAYRRALERGDAAGAYRARSYIAPPYCYDLNPWHGVTFRKAINGRVVKPSIPFVYQDMTHIKVRKLFERAGIGAMLETSNTELELIQKISDWANAQWGHMQPLPYATWDAIEILDRVETGDAYWCTFKAALFVQACNAAGLTARMLGINPRHRAAHTVTEVYINNLRKWMLVDPWLNCYFERDGVPLSAREFHNAVDDYAGIDLVFGDNGCGTEYWDFKTGKAVTIPSANKRVPLGEHPRKGLIEYYFDIRIVMRNDHTVHPQSKENIFVDGFMVPYNARGGEWWGPQLHWTDNKTPPQLTCDNTNILSDLEWPLNEVYVELRKISVPGDPAVLEARFGTLTPCFIRYDLDIDGVKTPVDGDVFVWKLKKGINTLGVCSVNAAGRKGFTSEFELEYDPSLVDFSRRVDIALANPGFEEADPKSPAKTPRPLTWSTICSNALREGEYRLDKKTKRSGKYALKAVPAKDPKTGIEYAFIVRSVPFEVNPATDVVYSVWLRAGREGTPVDICLLDSTYKGQGTYVKRVETGKAWKQYSLPCRLNNELTKVYVGFKVYTGTVWADDASFEETGTAGE